MLRACAALILASAGGGGTRTSAMGKVIFIFDRFGSRESIDNLVLADDDQ